MQAIGELNPDQLGRETRPVRNWYAGGFARVAFACEHPYDRPADISGLIGYKYRGIGKKEGWGRNCREQRSDYATPRNNDMLGLADAKARVL